MCNIKHVVGRGSSVAIATCYDGARFSAPVHTVPGAHLAPVKWVPDLISGGKAAGAWPSPPTPI
jgi:hypothetical protein